MILSYGERGIGAMINSMNDKRNTTQEILSASTFFHRLLDSVVRGLSNLFERVLKYTGAII